MVSPSQSHSRTPPAQTRRVHLAKVMAPTTRPYHAHHRQAVRCRVAWTHNACHSRTHDTRCPWDVVIERVVRESGNSRKWPQLARTNYNLWSLFMKLKLQAHYLRDAIKHGDVEFHDDRMAPEAIYSGVPQR